MFFRVKYLKGLQNFNVALVQLPGNRALVNFKMKPVNASALGSMLNLVLSRLWGLGETGERTSIL